MKYLKVPKNASYHELWEGDFDGDGVINIDDTRPFNKDIARRVNKEVSLSESFLKLKLRRKAYKKSIPTFLNLVGADKVRVKGLYSTINKQLGKNISHVKDMGGTRVYTKSRQDSLNRVNALKKKIGICEDKFQKRCIIEIENIYKNKENGKISDLKNKKELPNLSYHVIVRHKGRPHEVQYKCKEMQDIHNKSHVYYKRNQKKEMVRKFRPAVMDLYRKGC